MVRVADIDPRAPDPAVLAEAAAVLRAGGLVAFPTETVYGLGANALDPEAVGRIFAAKGRPADHPLIVHVASKQEARELAWWSPAAEQLADRFWPGPLTLVLPKKPIVPDVTTGGLDTVAVRVPNHAIALALLRAAALPLAAPSANPHTRVSPTTAAHVVDGLGDQIDLVLDGGPCSVGIESTVVALYDEPRVLRPGTIGSNAIAAVLGPLATGSPETERRSPGMAAVHYAPRAKVIVVDRVPPARDGQGRILIGEPSPPRGTTVVLPNEPNGYAAGLYAALHRLDALGCSAILVQSPPADSAWEAVRDRLGRAAAKG